MRRSLSRVARGATRRIKSRVHKLDIALGRSGPRQVIEFSPTLRGQSSRAPLHTLVVGPAQMPIPTNGWGAVEILIHEQISALSNIGVRVTLLNSAAWLDWLRARPWTCDVLLVHYESGLPKAFLVRALFHRPVVACSHYGYLQWPSKWDPGFAPMFRSLGRANAILALNPTIAAMLNRDLPREVEVVLAPNGSDADLAWHPTAVNDVIVLGKVEPRKRQYEVYSETQAFDITSVGPIVDERVKALVRAAPKTSQHFVGPWTRDEVMANLGNYRVLLLASDGEADALVLYEAQLAGLVIVGTSAALGAQNRSLPWVFATDDYASTEECLEAALAAATDDMRRTVRKYAEGNYRWRHRIGAILNSLTSVTS